jgi:hypothetical protein
LLSFALIALAACVGPARTFDVYEGKAVSAAEAVRSAVETARLAVAGAEDGDATGQYLSVVLHEAEVDATGAEGAFSSIQPPDRRADELRDELETLFQDAVDTLAKLRIAARRTELEALSGIAEPLAETSEKLDRFIEEHR